MRTKAARAALELARERDWGDLSLCDIAQAAGLTLADLRREFTWKSDILKAFQAAVDAEVLTKVELSVGERAAQPKTNLEQLRLAIREASSADQLRNQMTSTEQ